MKGTEHFKEVIKNYLDKRAEVDELFRAQYESTTRTIEDIVTYILNEVKKSGCCGFADEEIYSLAVHAVDEPQLEVGEPLDCKVVVNHSISLTEEEKAEQRAKQHEADFYKEKSRYFGIILKDDELEISVLDSLDAYKAEGDAMKHCVFRCEYYAKSDTLVLSAHDKSGNRIETIELSLYVKVCVMKSLYYIF